MCVCVCLRCADMAFISYLFLFNNAWSYVCVCVFLRIYERSLQGILLLLFYVSFVLFTIYMENTRPDIIKTKEESFVCYSENNRKIENCFSFCLSFFIVLFILFFIESDKFYIMLLLHISRWYENLYVVVYLLLWY